MKSMKKITMIAAVFFALAFVTAFADTAMAKPDWVTVKYTGWTYRVNKNTKENAGDHISVELKFDIINNSKNGDVMTAIYNRTISWNGVFTLDIPYRMFEGDSPFYSSEKANAKYSMRGTNPYKGEWWPGQVYKYVHYVPLKSVMKPIVDWLATNRAIKRVNHPETKEKPDAPKFGLSKWSLDFQVQSHR